MLLGCKQLRLILVALSASLALADDHLAPDGTAIDGATWNAMINHMGRQRMFSQRMAKAFLMITKGVNVDGSKTDLQKIIGSFDGTLNKLINGDEPYSKPPVQMVYDGLQTVKTAWSEYKSLLENNMDTVTPESVEVLGNLSTQNIDVLKKSNAVVGMYVDSAKSFGAATAGLQVDVAGRQRMLTQRMSKEAFFVGLNFNKAANLKNLEGTMDLFSESHEGILQGVNFVGLGQTTKKCTLWQMRTVSDLWNKFQPLLQQILDAEEADLSVLQIIADNNINLLVQMNVGVGLYVSDDGSKCEDVEKTIDVSGWANLINGGGKQRMMGQKASRLFFQIAHPRGVNRAASEVTLTGTMTTGGESLRALIEGSVASNMPAPPNQEIADKLITLWASWKKFSTVLDGFMKAAVIQPEVIRRVSRLSVASLTSMNEAVEMYVSAALVLKPEVKSIVINIAGRQRMYQAKMSKEALLVVLGEEPEANLANMDTTATNFLSVHWQLLLGLKSETDGSTLIERTTDACMLNQMNLVLQRFTALRALCQTIAESGKNANMEHLEELDVSNPVAFATMNTAVSMYARGSGTCTLAPSDLEWDMVLTEVSTLRMLIEKVAKDFFFTTKELNTTSGSIYMPGAMDALADTLHQLAYGNPANNIYTPPSQVISNKLFAVTDAYVELAAKLTTKEPSEEDIEEVATLSNSLADHAAELMELYIDDAWEKEKTVEGARLNATGTLFMSIEKLQKQVVLMQFPDCEACKQQAASIPQTMQLFDETYQLLMNGNVVIEDDSSTRRLLNATKTSIRATTTNQLVNSLKEVKKQWDVLKPAVQSIVERYESDGKTPATFAVAEIADKSEAVSTDAQAAVTLFSTSSRTTTSVPLDLLTPVPLTGAWAAGRTMRTAARFAEDVINDQQLVIPGFAIKNRFFDDMCDSQEGMRVVLKESVNDDYIALAGMGCSAVCESAAFAASSMNMPFLSYECSGEALSDQTQFPDFVRFGTPLARGTEILQTLVEQYRWPRLTIMSGNPERYRPEVQQIQTGLVDAGVTTEYYSSYDTTFAETLGAVSAFVAAKRRVIMLVGDEGFYRRVVCATRVAGANLGITWLYQGIVQDHWWTVDDEELMNEQPDCTGASITESFEGAINIAGLGKALPEDASMALDCFDGYTSQTFLEALTQHLHEGYPDVGNPETVVQRPHVEIIAHSADGVCAFAKTMAHLLAEGNSVEDLRRPSSELYRTFVDYMKTGLAFQGVSGWVNFTGNDKPASLAVKQVQGGVFTTVGYSFPNDSMRLDVNGGPVNDSWKPAKPDVEAEFPYFVFQVLTPILCVCCPALAGCIRSS